MLRRKMSPFHIRKKYSSQKELLRKDESVSNHKENTKEPAFEYLKFKRCFNVSSSNDIYMQLFGNHYNVQNKSSVSRPPIESVM